jgi:hypothetical protein
MLPPGKRGFRKITLCGDNKRYGSVSLWRTDTEKVMRKTAITFTAIALAGALAVAPAVAQARDWGHRGGWGHEWRDHDDAGAAIGLGILGGILAGAAIASSQAYAPPVYYYQPPAYYSSYGYAGYGYYR